MTTFSPFLFSRSVRARFTDLSVSMIGFLIFDKAYAREYTFPRRQAQDSGWAYFAQPACELRWMKFQ